MVCTLHVTKLHIILRKSSFVLIHRSLVNSPYKGQWFPSQRPVMRSFDVFFDLRLNKWLSKQSWGWWFETPSRPLWRHCNENACYQVNPKIPEPGSHMHDHTYIYHKPYWLLQQFDDWATRESHPETTACAKHSCSWWRHQMETFSA